MEKIRINFAFKRALELVKFMHQENERSEVRLVMHALFQRLQRYGALANIALN